MSGCADKGHNELPCTRCQVSQDDFFSDESLTNGEYLTLILFYWFCHKLIGYRERDMAQHIAKAYEYAKLDSESVRQEFFKKHGVRWYEFAQLPYFDPVKMTIIDPMHNLLICMSFLSYVSNNAYGSGVLKNHWYGVWILGKALQPNTAKTKRELDLIHEQLNMVRVFFLPALNTSLILYPQV